MSKEWIGVLAGMEQESGNNPFLAWASICSDRQLASLDRISRLETFKNSMIYLLVGRCEINTYSNWGLVIASQFCRGTASGQIVYFIGKDSSHITYSCLTPLSSREEWEDHMVSLLSIGVWSFLLFFPFWFDGGLLVVKVERFKSWEDHSIARGIIWSELSWRRRQGFVGVLGIGKVLLAFWE